MIFVDKKEFWKIIEQAAENSDGDMEVQYDIMVENLSSRSDEDILTFNNIFDIYYNELHKHKLWAASYLINGDESEDVFDAFKGFIIVNGKDMVLGAMLEPDSLSEKLEEGLAEFEDVLYLAGDAYLTKHGGEEDEFNIFYDKTLKHKLSDDEVVDILAEIEFAEDIDKIWEEGDLEKYLPKLFKKYISEKI